MGGKIKETWAPGYIIMGDTKGRKEKCQELIQWMRGVGSCCCAAAVHYTHSTLA
jgi:hypothetical protein